MNVELARAADFVAEPRRARGGRSALAGNKKRFDASNGDAPGNCLRDEMAGRIDYGQTIFPVADNCERLFHGGPHGVGHLAVEREAPRCGIVEKSWIIQKKRSGAEQG